jgi:hypothetical protein
MEITAVIGIYNASASIYFVSEASSLNRQLMYWVICLQNIFMLVNCEVGCSDFDMRCQVFLTSLLL